MKTEKQANLHDPPTFNTDWEGGARPPKTMKGAMDGLSSPLGSASE